MAKLPAPSGWADYINGWLESLAAQGCTVQTTETRRRKMSHMARLFECMPEDVTADMLMHVLATQNWSHETLRGYTVTARSFFEYLEHKNIVNSLSIEVPHVSERRGVPHPVPERFLIAALSNADASEVLMLRLGAECGLRRNEIAQVHSHDVIDDLLGRSLIVHGKGGKERIVPLPDDLANLLEQAHGFVFPGRWSGHVEPSYIGKHVSRLLPDGFACHSLRHRFATRTYESTHDILVVSKLLGHESVHTTQIYIALPQSALRDAVNSVRIT